MEADEVVKREVETERVNVARELLRERIRQAREATVLCILAELAFVSAQNEAHSNKSARRFSRASARR